MHHDTPSKRALLVGLTNIDPARHDGWDGKNACQGCAKDVLAMQQLLGARGWETTCLIDHEATCFHVRENLRKFADLSQPGDSIAFYFSGHGGQLADDDGDEPDQRDETLICYDGHLRDDTLNTIWLSCREDVRIYMLADCCNSGSNYKNIPGDQIIPKTSPVKIAADLSKSADSMRSRLLHLGGCRDGYTSTGLNDGGAFTLALQRHVTRSPQLTWRALYDQICNEVADTQDPALNPYPNLDNNLDQEPALDPPILPLRTAQPATPPPASTAPPATEPPTPVNAPEDASVLARIDERNARIAAARAASPGTRGNGPRLVAEGDSWFDFPLYPDVIDCLSDRHGYNIVNVSKAGACVYEMAYGPDDDSMFDVFDRDDSQLEEFVKKIRQHRPQGLLLSGAGNDFVGPEFIMTIHHAAAKKSGANMALVNALFQHDVEPGLECIIATATDAGRQANLGTLPIVTHGYDYAIATGNAAANLIIKKIGPWMDPSFRAKGYPKDNDADLIRRINIVRPMVDGLYTMLERLRAKYPNLHIVDVRNTLPDRTDWHDELHPTREGFRKVAALFDAEIRAAIGHRRSSASFPGNTLEEPAPDLGLHTDASPAATPIAALNAAQLTALAASRMAREAIAPADGSDPTGLLDRIDAARFALHDDLQNTVTLPADIAAAEDAEWQALADRLHGELRLPCADEDQLGRSGTTRSRPTFEERRSVYDSLFASCRVRPQHLDTVAWYVRKLREGERRYRSVGDALNIPWEFIGIIHGLECSFRFDQHLHNGDPLTRRTVRVPAGHPRQGTPPFTWEESAKDALKFKSYHLQSDWSAAAMLYRFENYNGWGYFYRNMHSPYLWSFSQHYTRGKFVRDRVFDPAAVSRQCGAAVMLKALRPATRSASDEPSPLITLTGGRDENDPASYIDTIDLRIFDLDESDEPVEDTPADARGPHHDSQADAWDLYPEFEHFVLGLNLRYFSAREFLLKGNSHYSGGCAGRNTHPPRHLWNNIAATARVLDELRHRLGYPIRLLSAYRSPAYNKCIDGAGGSMHMTYKAIDFKGSQGTPVQWAAALRLLRSRGLFRGGIGTYSSFVHVDTRGENKDW